MTFQITTLYAVLLAVLALVLSVMVSIHRGKTGVSLGSGGDTALQIKMRRFGNFEENVPLALILLALAEAAGAGATWLHASGAILLVSRLVHPFGLDPARPAAPARIAGSLGTKLAMLIAIVAILAREFAG